MKGRTLNFNDNVVGRAMDECLPEGFFLEQRIEQSIIGMELRSLELICYDAETKTFPSYVYSNMSPAPLLYEGDIPGDKLTISVSYGSIDATFKGKFGKDGKSFSGGWPQSRRG